MISYSIVTNDAEVTLFRSLRNGCILN